MTEKEKKSKAKGTNVENKTVENINVENLTASKICAKAVNAGKADIDHSFVAYMRSVDINEQNCANGIVVAKNIKTDSLKSVVAIADNIEGDVQTLLDRKGAFVFGLAFAGFVTFFRILRKLFR